MTLEHFRREVINVMLVSQGTVQLLARRVDGTRLPERVLD